MRLIRFNTAVVILVGTAFLFTSCASSPEAKSAKYMENGKKLMAKNDPSRAILQFQNAIKATPKSDDAYYQLAMAFLAAGDAAHGVGALRKTLELNPRNNGAQLVMARLMASTSDQNTLEDARSRLQAMLQESPDSPDALHTLALTELKLGEPENAVRDLSRAMVSAPQNLVIAMTLAQAKLQQGDSAGAEAVLKDAYRNSPKSVGAIVLLGKFYTAENRAQEAEQKFREALTIDANDSGALYGLGMLQMAVGKKQDAEQTFRKLSRLKDKEAQISLAAFLIGEGRNDEGVQEISRLFKENPDDRRLRTWLVKTYVIANRSSEAEKLLKDVLKKNPKDFDALLQRAEMSLDRTNLKDAETDLNQLVHMQANSPEVHYTLGRLYLARKEELRYRQELSEALRINPSLLAVRVELAQNLTNNREPRAALDLLNAAPQYQRTSLAVIVQKNWACWALNDNLEMRKGIEAGLAQKRTPDLLVQDGMLKLRNGDAKAAVASLEEALKVDPTDLRVLTVLSKSYFAEKNGKAAVQKVKDLAAQQPKSAAVQDFLGMLLMGTGDPGDRGAARAAFMAAKAANPHFEKADFALVQLDVLEGKSADAQKRLQGILSSNGNNSMARLWLGNVAEMRGDHKTAIEQFRNVVATNPSDAEALNNLAYLLSEYGNSADEALQAARRAVELSPDRPAYCDTLGWVLYQKGLYSSAIPYLRKASVDPKQVVWKYHLAMAYAKAGDLTNGRVTLDAALRVNSRVPEAKQAQQVFEDSH